MGGISPQRNARNTPGDEALIKMLMIENETNSETNGKVTFYLSGKTETLPASITVEESKLNIVTTKNSWQMDVYKATEEELIFGVGLCIMRNGISIGHKSLGGH